MKYFYSSVIFLAFLFVITNTIDFNYTQEVDNIDMSDNNIKKIVVDLQETNVSFSSTVDKDVKIEHIYSKEQQPTSNLYTYQQGDTLFVNEYPYNKSNLISKKETINIYIPEEYVFDEIEIVNNSGQINIDGLNTTKLDLESTSGNVDVANLNTQELVLNGGQFGVSMSNVDTNELTSNVDKVDFNINNCIIDQVDLTATQESSVRIQQLVTNEVKVDGTNTTVELKLNPELDYQIITPMTIGNTQFKAIEDGYEYTKNNSKKKVKYDLSNIRAVSVSFDEPTTDQDESNE